MFKVWCSTSSEDKITKEDSLHKVLHRNSFRNISLPRFQVSRSTSLEGHVAREDSLHRALHRTSFIFQFHPFEDVCAQLRFVHFLAYTTRMLQRPLGQGND